MLIDGPIRSVRDQLLLLRSLPAFAPIEDGVLSLLAEHARVRRVRRDTQLLTAGEPIHSAFIVLEGAIRWARKDRPTQVAERHQVVGWITLMARDVGGLDAAASEDSLVLELPAETLELALEDHFGIIRNLMRLGASGVVRARGQLPVAPDRAPPVELGDESGPRKTMVERVLAMRQAPIFRRCSVEAVIALARNWRDLTVEPGEIIWRVGDESRYWVLVEYGRVTCTSESGQAVDVGSGFVLGIMDAIAQLPRSYEARAATRIVGSRIEVEAFMGVLEAHFDLARDFLAYLSATVLDGG
ncbi:MAG: cyclic nucleotide-binding domain-containing protein [Polyangiaceae bacterium]|nr:cyclic nucleotide-binding domain-containing protein [Polyangiaceae bacterium]